MTPTFPYPIAFYIFIAFTALITIISIKKRIPYFNHRAAGKKISLFWDELKDKLIEHNACETYSAYTKLYCPERYYLHDPINIDIDRVIIELSDGRCIDNSDMDIIKAMLLHYVKTAICIKDTIEPIVKARIEPLLRQRKILTTKDPYGDIDYSKWQKEAKIFLETKARSSIELWHTENNINFSHKFIYLNSSVFSHYLSQFNYNESEYFIGLLTTIESIEKTCVPINVFDGYSEDLNGYEYERYIASTFEELGYESYVTQGSGDQGVDVIVDINGWKIAIQCKHYNSKVSNKAIQEVYAAKGIYDCDFAIVVSNNNYTKSAREAAAKLHVELLHHEEIPSYIKSVEENYPMK